MVAICQGLSMTLKLCQRSMPELGLYDRGAIKMKSVVNNYLCYLFFVYPSLYSNIYNLNHEQTVST